MMMLVVMMMRMKIMMGAAKEDERLESLRSPFDESFLKLCDGGGLHAGRKSWKFSKLLNSSAGVRRESGDRNCGPLVGTGIGRQRPWSLC